jgi:oligopeptide/dipeptide ABC transporter ATP-binding protein
MSDSSTELTNHKIDHILRVESLKVYFSTNEGMVRAVDGVNLSINEGETLCLVGESGSGKSVTALSIVRLLSIPPAKIVSGKIIYKELDLLKVSDEEIRNIRGDDIAYIFQDSLESLNPLHTVVAQIAENLKTHRHLDHEDAIFEAIRMMQIVGIPAAEERASSYPHQFSGGMRQRVMTAIALSCNPTLLIADEPTTSLDVSIQAQVLSLLKILQTQYNTSILFITHDFAIVAEIADRIAVMYAGEIVEEGVVMNIFESPAHPYTQALFQSIPQIERKKSKRKKLKAIAGSSPNMISPPKGCRFNPRCQKARNICREKSPPISELNSSHIVKCHLYTGEPLN